MSTLFIFIVISNYVIIVAIVPCSSNDRLLRVNNILLLTKVVCLLLHTFHFLGFLEPRVLDVIQEDVTEYLTSENLTENDLSKVLIFSPLA